MKIYFNLIAILLFTNPSKNDYAVCQLNNYDVNNSNCKKAMEIYNTLLTNFNMGISVYGAKRVRTTFVDGKPKYKIKGKNKSIQFLENFTKIKGDESKDGTYIITKDILLAWNNWLNANCKYDTAIAAI